MLLRACLERGAPDDGYALIVGRDLSVLVDEEERLLAAHVLVASGHADKALALAGGESAEALLLRTRAFLALDRIHEARQAYGAAIGKNPALEDMELKKRLTGQVREFGRPGDGPRLRVISNDDTTGEELVRLLEPEAERITFADVGGLSEVKEQIRRKIILPFQKPSLFQRFKKKAGGGILLYGPPGCGKTLLARATAGECQAKFFNVAISDVLDMYIGESERKLHAIFEAARRAAPAVIFFDEIEAIGGKRQYARESTSAKVVSQFLSEMDGFAQANAGVLILGATNVPWAVDPAFRRPGRFDRVVFVPPPDREARESILRLLLEGRPVHGTVDVEFLAKNTAAFSGADLRNVVETAIEEAIESSLAAGKEVPLTDAHVKAALRRTKPTTLEWLTSARNHARYANEAGQYDDVLQFLERHGKA